MSAYQVEYAALWPNTQYHAIGPTQDKESFFEEFDDLCHKLQTLEVPKALWPNVEVRALEWSPWVSYGRAQEKGWA